MHPRLYTISKQRFAYCSKGPSMLIQADSALFYVDEAMPHHQTDVNQDAYQTKKASLSLAQLSSFLFSILNPITKFCLTPLNNFVCLYVLSS